MDLINEIWKPIPSYRKRYEISTFGNVRRWFHVTGSKGKVYHKKLDTPRIVKQSTVGNYLSVGLSINGNRSQQYVHRLMLITFKKVKNYKHLYVNHKDFNTKNNRIGNLEWVTPLQNTRYSIENGRFDKMPEFRRNRELKKVANGIHPFMRPDVQEKMNIARKNRWANSGNSKLTEKDVLDIFSNNLSSRQLAIKYGVGQPIILAIKNGKSWTHITHNNKSKIN
jgi:putative lipoic acid-binding regulatory protein